MRIAMGRRLRSVHNDGTFRDIYRTARNQGYGVIRAFRVARRARRALCNEQSVRGVS